MSSVNHTYSKNKQTGLDRKQELAASNTRLGLIITGLVIMLVIGVFMYRGGL